MTREEKLYSMKMTDLTNVANKLGIKINKDAAKSEAVEKILAAENNGICADGSAYSDIGKEIAEQAKQKAEQAKLVPMPGTTDPNWGEKHFSDDIDETLLVKLTKKQQRIITKIYKDDDRIYHVTVNYNGNISDLKDKSLSKIYLMINAIIKGE